MDEDLYDEFGNFIGDLQSSEEEGSIGDVGDAYLRDDEEEEEAAVNDQALMEIDDEGPSNAVVLHEDKQ